MLDKTFFITAEAIFQLFGAEIKLLIVKMAVLQL
jgi:hypothetical protein